MWSRPSTWGHRRAGLAVVAAAFCAVTVLSPAAAGGAKKLRPPSNVALVGVTATSLSLSWSAPRPNGGWGRIAGYGLYRNGTRVGTTKDTRYTFEGLPCGTTSTLGVDSYNAAGQRSQTVTLTASTAACAPGDTSPPSSPLGLSQTAATATGISLAWNASADDVGVAGYGVYRYGANVGTTTGTSFTFANLACGTTYTLGVDAFDAAGNRSTIATVTASTAACRVDSTAPSMPTGLMQSAATTTSIALRWNPATDDVGVAGYRLYLKGAPVATTSQTTHTLESLACGTGYVVAVEAYDAAGNRSPQASLVAATSACQAPTTRIYWGAFIDGDPTYVNYYGGSWGDAPWDANTWSKFESNAGKKVSVVHWGMPAPWLRQFKDFQGTFELVRNAGDLNAVDISTGSVPLRDIAAGMYDSYLTAWVQQAAAWGHPFFLLPDVEMNGTWAPYSPGVNGNTPSDFVNMWRHLHDLATVAGATNITWVWCPNVDPQNIFTPYEQLYPGHAYVDWTCLDGFNFDGKSTFSWLFGSSYQKLLQIAPGKPVMISQTGSVEGGNGKAAWITDALSTQLPTSFPNVKAFLWFNWRIYENGKWWDWPIESSATAQAAFRTAIASPYYAPGGGFGNLLRGSKITAP
jgi:chitodextrinase